ncbi:restriction endonuclease [Streptomyces hirsutus]|uniref:restriction endonuclease n=1 Tax=Streptomyces hirsutus TaxID=35620 RepID=UPI00099F225D|nr:restriction endonuclease [Streptomyces hirsutus]
MNQRKEWEKYQIKVSETLSEFGFATKVEEVIEGARGRHEVDVTARIRYAGIDQLWIVECKKWKRPVPKERVLAFASIIDDVGADRGLIFAEGGFQAGAVRASRNSSITLTNLIDFVSNSANELSSIKVSDLVGRIAELENKFHSIWNLNAAERNRVNSRYIGPESFGLKEPIAVRACLSMLKDSLEAASFNRWPVPYRPLDQAEDYSNGLIDVKNWDGLLFVAEKTLETCDRIYGHMIGYGNSDIRWQDLQPPELTDLLAAIRNMSSD